MLRSISALFASLALLIGVFAGNDADASTALSRIVKKSELRVGMSGNQPPLNVKSRSGEMIGLEVDLAKLLARAMGVELNIVEMPFSDLLGALKKGTVDMVMSGMTITLERNLEAAFVGPYFVSGKSILTRADKLSASDSADEINHESVTLAALRGSTSQKFVEVNLPKAKLETTTDYDAGVQMVLDGKVDALVADYPICMLSVLRNQGKVNALQGTGALELLKAKWFEDGSWLQQLP
jgi:polar amino acid transport system substrate-binding protein